MHLALACEVTDSCQMVGDGVNGNIERATNTKISDQFIISLSA